MASTVKQSVNITSVAERIPHEFSRTEPSNAAKVGALSVRRVYSPAWWKYTVRRSARGCPAIQAGIQNTKYTPKIKSGETSGIFRLNQSTAKSGAIKIACNLKANATPYKITAVYFLSRKRKYTLAIQKAVKMQSHCAHHALLRNTVGNKNAAAYAHKESVLFPVSSFTQSAVNSARSISNRQETALIE